jgi:hypothetical protein
MTIVRFTAASYASFGEIVIALGFVVPGKTTVTIQSNTDPALAEAGWVSVQTSTNHSANPGQRGATLPVTVIEGDVVKGVAYRAVIL